MRGVLALLAGLLIVGSVSPPSAAAGATCSQSFLSVYGSSCDKVLKWSYDPQLRAFVREGRQIGSLDAVERRYHYEISIRCEGSGLCGASAFTCQPIDGQRGVMSRALARPLRADGSIDMTAPTLPSYVCDYPGQVVPLATVQAAAHQEISKQIATPIVTSAPPGKTLVNLPTIFAASRQPEQSIDFTDPVPGRVVAVPEYSWDFGDGLTGLGPGLAYQPGDLPSRLPGKYLTATYTTPGSKHVVVTVTWRVRFVLEGVVDVPLAPIIMTAAGDKQVSTAKAVLVH